jgi:hypothetical protein
MLKIIGNGVNTPVFQNFIELDSSQGFDATSGATNLIQGVRLYNEYYFSVTQVFAPITVATAYTLALTNVTEPGATLVVAPTGGTWPAGTTITPSVTGITGTFSPATVSPTGANTGQIAFTATASGTAVLSVADNQGLTDPSSVSQAFSPGGAPGVPLTWTTANGATITGNNVALAATGNGSIATPAIDATQPFEVIINWAPSNSSSGMVAYIASDSNTSFAWPNPSGLIAGMYRTGADAITVPPLASPVSIGTRAESAFIRMRKSGNDVIMDRSVDGVTYAGARTITGVLTGQTQVWLKVLAAVGAANLDVNLYV